ncbi:hypothetical protein FACS1894156_8340 [Bacteroidia bacterium]|nr:hypothetical protein FACS1894156_8340 [Bacteroidia bacterium]
MQLTHHRIKWLLTALVVLLAGVSNALLAQKTDSAFFVICQSCSDDDCIDGISEAVPYITGPKKATGIYDTIIDSKGYYLDLTVRDTTHKNFYYTYCKGKSQTFSAPDGNDYTLNPEWETGVYRHVWKTKTPMYSRSNNSINKYVMCDSIIVFLHVTVNKESSNTFKTIEIFDTQKDSIYAGKKQLNVSGRFEIPFTNVNGCDSVEVLTVIIHPTYYPTKYDTTMET